MTEEEKDREEKKDNVEEKRIKSTVIRRRSKKRVAREAEESAEAKEKKAAAEAPEKEAPAEEKPAEAPAAKAPAKKAPKAAKKTAAKAEKPAAKKAEKPAAKAPAEAKEAKKPAEAEKKTPEEIFQDMRAEEAKKEEKAEKKEKKAKGKKEVKVFEKEAELKKFYTAARPQKKGKRFKRGKGGRRGQPQVQPTRPVKKTEVTTPKAAKRVIRIEEAISVGALSQKLGVKAGDIIKKLMDMGIMATVNQFIDVEAASLIASDYDYEVESTVVEEEALMEPKAAAAEAGKTEPRAPVVTIMGHVDHGKTTLLDAIRKTNVVGGEAGGITQHIGAYHVHLDRGDITFLDTPGHEAFTSMRARGAKVTDIVILVVAADDGVMPQTVEAINHAKAAEVPIIVAVNKVDLPDADPDRVKGELGNYGLVPEDWGGDTIFMDVSAKKGTNIKELLEMVIIQAEMQELKAAPESPARGIIVEAKLDKGRGPVATVLIQNGTLKVGEAFVTGFHHGRIRAMVNDLGKRVKSAGPSMPIEILGLSGVPEAGDTFSVVQDETTARQIASMRETKSLEKERMKSAKVSLDDLYDRISKGVKELNLIIKADVHGSIEAIKDSLEKLSTEEVQIKAIHTGVGGINEGDVMLAAASEAIIIGFNVRPETKARDLAERESVDIRLYNIIYNLVEDIKKAMEGLLEPIVREEVLGRAEVRDVFKVTKTGTVAGCFITDGKAIRGSKVRLVRDNVVVYEGEMGSLKRFKDDVKEVATGYECGMTIEGYNDIKVGDVIEVYTLREEAAKL